MSTEELNTTDMVSTTKRLSQIMATEISMLKDMKLSQLHTLYEEKMQLASVLEGYKQVLSQNPEIVKSLSKRTTSEMKDAFKTFEVLLEEDSKQIKRAKSVHHIVMDAVKKVLMKRSSMTSGYNKQGLLDEGKKKILYVAPVSVSESV